MSADIYADNVNQLKGKLAELQQQKIENYTDIANSITDNYNDMMSGYEDKWKGVQDAGLDDLAGLLGVKGVFKGGKKLYDLYQKRKQTKTKEPEEEDEEFEGFGDEEGTGGQIDDGFRPEGEYYNEDGDMYFKGSAEDHDNFYNSDGTLKDPNQVPEGHQANNAEDDEDDNLEDDEPELDAQPPQQSTLQNPGDDVADTDRGGADLGDDEFADDPSFLNPDIQPSSMIQADPVQGPSIEGVFSRGTTRYNQIRPTEAQLEADPFQPTANQSLSSNFTRIERGPPVEGGEPVIAEPIAEGGEGAGGLLDTIGTKASEIVGKAGDMVGQAGDILNNVGNRIFTNLAQRGQNIRQGFQNVKNFFSRSGGDAAEAGGEAAEGAAEGAAAGGEATGGILSSLGIGDAVIGAVPVVGEIGLAIGGLVAIGEGIYHLFHHPKKPPAPPPAAPLTAPQSMTQKYSLALPSADSSMDRAASVGTF
jgi:hypothetical protein